MFIDKKATIGIVEYINLHIGNELNDYLTKLETRNVFDSKSHPVHKLIKVIESIVKRSELTYNDFDLRIPNEIKELLFDNYIEQYKDDEIEARNFDKLSKFI